MAIVTEVLNGVTVVTIEGVCYSEKATEIREKFQELSSVARSALVVDISALVTDSAGVRCIIEFEEKLLREGHRHYWVIPPNSRMEQILRLAGFLDLLPYGHCHSLRQALSRFSQPPPTG